MTPARRLAELPTLAAAKLVAREWDQQEGAEWPKALPFTRLAFSAIDKIAPSHSRVAAEISGYGETDLICYRTELPPELSERQEAAWKPLLEWCENEFGAKLHATQGVVFTAQPEPSLSRLNKAVAILDEFELAAFSELVTLTGSLVLGLTVERGFMSPEDAWRASRVDEDWQLEKWGRDAEAAEDAELKLKEMQVAHEFLEAIRN